MYLKFKQFNIKIKDFIITYCEILNLKLKVRLDM